MKRITLSLFAIIQLAGVSALAGPFVPAGDIGLRNDIQLLADAGIITGTVTTWPLAWGPILEDLDRANRADADPAVLDAIARLRARSGSSTVLDQTRYRASAAFSSNPRQIRGYDDASRGETDLGLGLSWMSSSFSTDVRAQFVTSEIDGTELRFDGSHIGVAVGNWSLSASTMDRWWGPGWDGSLILSNNARPIPSLVVDRIFTDPFESRWLSWLGPWDLTAMMGQLEEERFVPSTLFFGMRVAFRPFSRLEIGVSRTAQWCGDGRPCDFDTFAKLLFGQDNVGGSGIDVNNEPGNQLAGFDARLSFRLFGQQMATYGQFIGEDEAGGFPSRYFAQAGVEWSGRVFGDWSTRAFMEFAQTDCDVFGENNLEGRECSNYVYFSGIYKTGYRFRGRAIGHTADNDSRLLSVGAVANNPDGTVMRAILRTGELNRIGSPDPRHTLTRRPADLVSVEFGITKPLKYGIAKVMAGYETREQVVSGASDNEFQLTIGWQTDF